MKKEVLLTELETELSMRRKVWQLIYGQKEQFVSAEKQRRYDRLKTIGTILAGLSQGQINKILQDAEAENAGSNQNQQTLF